MSFLIITTNSSYHIEANDFSEAVDMAYDNHTGYDNIMAIVRIDT